MDNGHITWPDSDSPSTLDPPFLWVQSPVQAFLRPKTHLTGPAATPGQPPLAGPAGPISCQTTWIGKWRPWKAGCSCKDQDYWRCPVRPDSSQQTPSALSNSIFRPSPTNVNFPTWPKSANSSLSISANKSGRATYPWNTSLWEVMSVIFLCEWFFDNFLGLMCSLASFGDFKVRPILMRWHQNSL